MQAYFHFWELKIFQSLKSMVLRNLRNVVESLNLPLAPLFRVDARLSAPDIVLSPSFSELHQLLGRHFRQIVECTKSFPRWMHGTCEATPPVIVEGQDEPVVFSFYDDIASSIDVLSQLSGV